MLLPSVVRYLAQGGRQIGYEALAAQARDARSTIASVKRFMGRGLADVAQAQRLPYSFVSGAAGTASEGQGGGMLSLSTAGGVKSPVRVVAPKSSPHCASAPNTFDQELYGAVITVPAYFDDAQRQATQDGKLAGIHLLRLLNGPRRAVAGLDNAGNRHRIYDSSGGTFSTSHPAPTGARAC